MAISTNSKLPNTSEDTSGGCLYIKAFCTSCSACAAAKDANSKPKGLLHSLPIPDRPWQFIGMDFMGPLPQSNNFDYLLVMIDQLTSQVHLVLTTTTVTAKGIVWLILKEVVRLHRIPESIVSDRDTRFTSSFWKELLKLMGTKLHVHGIPPTNGWSY